MILKNLSRKSCTGQLLRYLFKENKLVKDNHKPLLIRHNVRARTLEKQVKEFDQNEKYRLHPRKNSVKVYHTILSFSNKDKDKINEKVLRDTALEYMKLRGNNNMFIGTAHYDKDHVHLHLVMSGTQYMTGETNRLSKAAFQQLKIDLETWQQKNYPELVNSLPHHGKKNELYKDKSAYNKSQINLRESQKQKLLTTLEISYCKSRSIDDFVTSLKKEGYEPYIRSGQLTGVKSAEDLKFRFSRLGYNNEKIAKLDAVQQQEVKVLSELRDLRESHSRSRDQHEVRRFQVDEKDEKGDDAKDDQNRSAGEERETERNSEDVEHNDEREIEEIDDIE